MKSKVIKFNNEYAVTVPAEYIAKLNLQENDCIDISLNLELTQIIIGSPDVENIMDIEADEDF